MGHDWTINNTMVNRAYYGEVFENYNFPNTYNPTGATQYNNGFGGNGSGELSCTVLTEMPSTHRDEPIRFPCSATISAGKKVTMACNLAARLSDLTPKDYTILNYNVPSIGLGGYTTSLGGSLRPTDICPSSSNVCGYAPGLYDAAFALALSPYTAVSSTFNYDAQGNAFPQGSGQTHTYRYYETELYFGDTWKVTPKLTLSYGLRWSNYSVPYDRNGIESIRT